MSRGDWEEGRYGDAKTRRYGDTETREIEAI